MHQRVVFELTRASPSSRTSYHLPALCFVESVQEETCSCQFKAAPDYGRFEAMCVCVCVSHTQEFYFVCTYGICVAFHLSVGQWVNGLPPE